MGKIATIMETGIAGLVNVLESRKEPAQSEKKPGFLSFVFRETTNYRYLQIAIIGAIIQITIFKFLYPYPDFISDSYSYISTNLYHMKVNLWPIGYSKFLALIHAITPDDDVLIFCQYAILICSLLYFFFSIRYLFKLSRPVSIILFIFLFFNPAVPYLSNCVLSDALFLALSLVWFTQLMHLLHRPGHTLIISLAVVTGLLFTLRYTAIYYPIAALPVFLFSRLNIRAKVLGIFAPLVFIVPFVIYTKQCTKEITGTAEFSVFGGWQIANNALYMYDHINIDTANLPAGSLAFNRMVRAYFDRNSPSYYDFQHFPGTWFIKNQDAPLKQYMFKTVKDTSWGFSSWGKVSPIYNSYGTHLIKTHPLAFARYYLLLNVINYFIPHLEKFGSYNIGTNVVWPEARYWFHYKSPFVSVVSLNLQGDVFFIYPTLFLLLNGYFLFLFAQFLVTKKFKKAPPLIKYTLMTGAFFLVLNFCFSVFATPVVLRYQLFPMILLLTCILLIVNNRSIVVENELTGKKVN